jgi:hypothetical protein
LEQVWESGFATSTFVRDRVLKLPLATPAQVWKERVRVMAAHFVPASEIAHAASPLPPTIQFKDEYDNPMELTLVTDKETYAYLQEHEYSDLVAPFMTRSADYCLARFVQTGD